MMAQCVSPMTQPMEQSPKISVVTVCRNSLPLLRVTVGSVISQSYGNVEYIVVDGASTDGTPKYVRSLGGKVAIFVSEPDNGIYDAMNKAIAHATGEWIIFMNAGDTFYSVDTLRQVFDSGGGYDGFGVVYGDVAKLQPDGSYAVKQAEPPHNSHRMFFCHQSAFYRRDNLLAMPFDVRHRMSADIHQVKRLLAAGVRFKQLHLPIAVFDTSGVSNVRRSDGLRDNIRVVRELDPFATQCRLLPRLCIPYLLCRLRGK